MKRLPVPQIPHGPLYDMCVAQTRNGADRAILQGKSADVVSAGVAYAAAAQTGRLDTVTVMAMTPRESQLMGEVYVRRLADRNGSGRWAYDEIRSAAPHCPFCLIGEVYELDHYLPQERFSELNVLPLNLVPICHPCNNIKLTRLPAGPNNHFLHPYFDQLPANVRWLFADITESANGPILNFRVQLDPQTYGALASRLDYHFRELRLDQRFRRLAATILAELEAEITEHLATLGAAQMAAHFFDLGAKKFARHGNTMDCAAYFAAAASPAYCSGGYRN